MYPFGKGSILLALDINAMPVFKSPICFLQLRHIPEPSTFKSHHRFLHELQLSIFFSHIVLETQVEVSSSLGVHGDL